MIFLLALLLFAQAGTVKKWPCPLNPSLLCQDAPQPQAETTKVATDLFVCTEGHIMGPCEQMRSAIPVDVPAIQKKRQNVLWFCTSNAGPECTEDVKKKNAPQWTCADPKRILEVAENGTDHWCRKVQP